MGNYSLGITKKLYKKKLIINTDFKILINEILITNGRIVPTATNGDKTIKGWGFREEKQTHYYFNTLFYLDTPIINNIFEFIKLIELLKLYNSNKLNKDEDYIINSQVNGSLKQKNGKVTLNLKFLDKNIFLSKFECAGLIASFNKILSKLEFEEE
jgi:hypothetical protein